ncbi:MAG: sensor histidine kinase, partial [Laribacter sp.]|nr:sensor histidine kinase [Laribacter sp.]
MPDADLPLKLVKLRWLWLAGLALSLAGLASAGIALPYPPLMLATAAAVVANLLWQSAPAHRLARLDMQLAWDALFLTELFFFTGGSANPLVSLYLLLIALSALTQPPRTTRALALACVLAYGVLFVWHRPLPPVPGGTDMLIALHLAGMWLTFAASAWVIGGPLARLALTL